MWVTKIFNKLNNAIDSKLERLFDYWEAIENVDRQREISEDNEKAMPYYVKNALAFNKQTLESLDNEEKIRKCIENYLVDYQGLSGVDNDYINRAAKYAMGMDKEELKTLSEYAPEEKQRYQEQTERKKDHQEQMTRWDKLSEAVGGDLFDDPRKLAAMREVDRQMNGKSNGRFSVIPEKEWQLFHDDVVEKIYGLPLVERPEPIA